MGDKAHSPINSSSNVQLKEERKRSKAAALIRVLQPDFPLARRLLSPSLEFEELVRG